MSVSHTTLARCMTIFIVQIAIAATPHAQSPDVPAHIVAIRVHGNHTTPDDEVVRLAGVAPRQPFTATTLDEVARRLRESHRFRSIDVRQRYQSLSDPAAVLLVIIVEERAGITVGIPSPSRARVLRAHTMWLPLLGYEDGYGWTYGARLAFPDLLGHRTRVGVPLTWGGERQVGVEIERTFAGGPISRVRVDGGVRRRENPAFDTPERRTGVAVHLEHTFAISLRIRGSAAVDDVAFGDLTDRVRSAGATLVLDTRNDPAFPRNALLVTTGVERLWFDGHPSAVRLRVDAHAYLGLARRVVLAVRGLHIGSNESLPPYEQALLGGSATVRGFRVGYRAGDQLAAASAELRVPITSPVRVGRFGVAMFYDTAAVYPVGGSLSAAAFDRGIGAGVFATAPMFSLRFDVARTQLDHTRAHLTLGFTF
jgi:outer membrane protein assembly factor BamA